MTKRWIVVSLVVISFAAAVFLSLDQYLRIGVWFQLGDIHHETLILAFFALGLGILIGYLFPRKV